MNRLVRIGLIAAAPSLLGGCVAAALGPAAALGMIGGREVLSGDRTPDQVVGARPEVRPLVAVLPKIAPSETASTAPPPNFQYLYGSGESAASSVQAYAGLKTYLRARSDERQSGFAVASVMLSAGSTIDSPDFEACGQKPLGVVLDIDETSVLNIGYEADEVARRSGYDEQRWLRWEQSGTWEQADAVPGAVDAVHEARKLGIAVIFNSNRSVVHADATARLLEGLGFGGSVLNDTLWLRDGDSGKDERRRRIAERYCVIALVGDQLADFSDLFNDPALSTQGRRAKAMLPHYAGLWGNGWFILPNPVYGTALRGSYDEVFPPGRRWADPTPSADAPHIDGPTIPAIAEE